MDKYLRKLTTVAKTHPDNVKSSSKSNSDIEIIEEKENIKQQIETKKCKVVLTRLNSKNKAIAEDQMDVDAKEQEHKTPEVQLDDTIEDEDTNEDVAKSVVNLASKDPSTPVGNTVKPGMASLSSSKKTKTPKSEAERQLANQTRLENLKKKEEEQRKREEARLKQEEERRKVIAKYLPILLYHIVFFLNLFLFFVNYLYSYLTLTLIFIIYIIWFIKKS